MVELNSVEEALDFLKSDASLPTDVSDVKFGGELTQFRVLIEGKKYHSTVPAALARGLWDFQEELYRAVAFALYGEDNIRRLTDEQKAYFELVFHVAEGSSDLIASLEGFFDKLADGFQNMDSSHKMKTLIAVVLTVAVVWGATNIVETWAETKQHEVTTAAEVKGKEIAVAQTTAEEAAKTAQFQLIGQIAKDNAVVGRFAKATEEGTRSIIKGAADADNIKIGRTNFNRSEINEVNQRAAKERATAGLSRGDYQVIRAEARVGGITRFWLQDERGQEFSATVFEDEFEAKGVNRLWESFRGRKKISLEVNATTIRGQIKAASIVRVFEQDVTINSTRPTDVVSTN
ncbi:hypothetical protein CR152_31880 [Massilia violaceinigra]|uniref:Uncharacterized protein n=1 Tax=Massilia violaceinigra TaxID=2045208 RepID=A0A2D2DUF4_9BURK|nr:hypothetical protein [Massilia violaceinigra]ATQ78607.1 hypothetical protein CR152_31880 [Massilia violaceinigra]